MRVGRTFFTGHPVDCARGLIGCELRWDGCSGVVVETEAYCETGDDACHTFFRPSARDFVERHRAGAAYVYLNYGMHWLANILVKGETRGFVLLRALAPCRGIEKMRERRGAVGDTGLCSGPGKLTRALGINGSHHGDDFCASAARGFRQRPEGWDGRVLEDRRIGISRATDLPWRFLLGGSPHLSRGPIAKRG